MACSKLELSTSSNGKQSGKLNVALTGKSGAGKSSFINAILNLKVGQLGAAHTDVKECTKTIQSYLTPNIEHITFWDLPGLGTDTYNKDNYATKVNLFQYDLYLIIGSERMTENELWLADIIRNNKKKFYFVRTKVHFDIKFEALSRATPRSKEEILLTIRSDCYSNLCRYGLCQSDIYLIDNFETKEYDFPFLLWNLKEESIKFRRKYVPKLYRQRENYFHHKRRALIDSAEQIAKEATLSCQVQTPGLGASVNIEVLQKETKFYIEQFEQGRDYINNHVELTGWHEDVIHELLNRNSLEIDCSTDGIVEFCKDIEICELMDGQCAMQTRRPETKSWSFLIALKYLNRTIDILHQNALNINKEITRISRQVYREND